MSQSLPASVAEEFCELLGVRADGVAPFVDLTPWTDQEHVRQRAWRLLGEHQSCEAVEIWRGGALLERVVRG